MNPTHLHIFSTESKPSIDLWECVKMAHNIGNQISALTLMFSQGSQACDTRTQKLTVSITVSIISVLWETILGQKSIVLVQREKKKCSYLSLLREGTSGIAERRLLLIWVVSHRNARLLWSRNSCQDTCFKLIVCVRVNGCRSGLLVQSGKYIQEYLTGEIRKGKALSSSAEFGITSSR